MLSAANDRLAPETSALQEHARDRPRHLRNAGNGRPRQHVGAVRNARANLLTREEAQAAPHPHSLQTPALQMATCGLSAAARKGSEADAGPDQPAPTSHAIHQRKHRSDYENFLLGDSYTNTPLLTLLAEGCLHLPLCFSFHQVFSCGCFSVSPLRIKSEHKACIWIGATGEDLVPFQRRAAFSAIVGARRTAPHVVRP
jgi:hypothetical protein